MLNKKLLAAIIIVIIVVAGGVAVWQLFLTGPSEPTETGPDSIKIGLVAPYQIPVGRYWRRGTDTGGRKDRPVCLGEP